MGKRINLAAVQQAVGSKVEKKKIFVSIGKEDFSVEVKQGISSIEEEAFLHVVGDMIDNIKQDLDIEEEVYFLIAVTQVFTDIDFSNLDIFGKIGLLGTLSDEGVLESILEEIPEFVIERLTELLGELTDFVQTEIEQAKNQE